MPREQPPVAWSRDSRSLWFATRLVTKPGGFALSGLRPARLTRSGITTTLPLLHSPAGPLDAIQWIGHDGLALAQFGTAGSYYRPEHDDPAPELAMVDIARGKVLDRLPLANLVAFRARKPGFSAKVAIGWASGTVRRDGRVAALVAINGGIGHHVLVHWWQGLPPRQVSDPAPEERWTRGVLLPLGDRFLLTRELQPIGREFICEIWNRNCPRVPPPRPHTGPLLQLRDVATGQIRWTLNATTDQFWRGDVLSVAPDGRFALVSYPPVDSTARIAVVRLSDGVPIQVLPLAGGGGGAGFTENGRTIWVRGNGAIQFYRQQ